MMGTHSYTSLDDIVIQERTKQGWEDAQAEPYSQESKRRFLDLVGFCRRVTPEVEYRVVRRTARVTEEVI